MIAASRCTHFVEHVHVKVLRVGCHLFTALQNLLGTKVEVVQGDVLVFVDGNGRLKLQSAHAATADEGQFVDGCHLLRTEMMFSYPRIVDGITPAARQRVGDEGRQPRKNVPVGLSKERQPIARVMDGGCQRCNVDVAIEKSFVIAEDGTFAALFPHDGAHGATPNLNHYHVFHDLRVYVVCFAI